MNKLTKAQEKRFPTKELHRILKVNYKPGLVEYLQASHQLHEFFKQHLADELAREREKMEKEIEKGFSPKDVPDWIKYRSVEWEAFYQGWTKRSLVLLSKLSKQLNE